MASARRGVKAPTIELVEVVAVTYVVGEGLRGDPARNVVDYHSRGGDFLARRDAWLTGETLRDYFRGRGWSIDTGTEPSPDPFGEVADLFGAGA
jgi:hypothetical protein